MNLNGKKYFNARKAETSSIKSALQELLCTYKIEDKYTATQITTAWGRIMGEPISRRTEKIFMKGKKLFVKLNSAPLKNELSLSKDKIVALFAQEFGHDALEEIIFL